jgi:hypothetical protein
VGARALVILCVILLLRPLFPLFKFAYLVFLVTWLLHRLLFFDGQLSSIFFFATEHIVGSCTPRPGIILCYRFHGSSCFSEFLMQFFFERWMFDLPFYQPSSLIVDQQGKMTKMAVREEVCSGFK